MPFLKPLLTLLLIAATLLTLAILALIAHAIATGTSITNDTWPVFLGALAAAALLTIGARQLGRRGHPGLGCLLLLLGFPVSFAGFIVMLFVVSPSGHH